MPNENETGSPSFQQLARPAQRDITAAPTFFVDALVGTATANSVTRLTLGLYKHNIDVDAGVPVVDPCVTICIQDQALENFAVELLELIAWIKARGAANPNE